MTTFAERLKEIMIRKGWTQKKLAEEVGMSQITISAYIGNCKRHVPSIDVVAKIARALNVPIGWLCGDDDIVDTVFEVIIDNSSEVVDILSNYQFVKNELFSCESTTDRHIKTLIDCHKHTKAQLQKIWEAEE